jgi:hypothetical protein
LLFTIASWFHDIYDTASKTSWLSGVVAKLRRQKAAVVSFNWDLILDQLLFQGELDSESYGLSDTLGSGPLLLKPHGSLNWYEGTQLKVVSDVRRIEIFHSKKKEKCVHAFCDRAA